MRSEKFEFHVPFSKLLIGLLVTVTPISIVALYSYSRSEHSLQRAVGNGFKAIADSTAAEVSQFVHDRVIDVGMMAIDPSLVDAVTAANRAYQGQADSTITARMKKLEESWNTPAATPIVNTILSSRTSRTLRQRRELDQRFLRVLVTDEKGAVVAATHKPVNYYQAEEGYWQSIYANGRGAINVTDILFDEVTKSNYIGVGAPILEEGSNRFIGAVDALVDLSSLFPIVNRSQVGRGLQKMLVKDDGTVIAAPQVSLSMNLKSDEFAAVRDAMGTLRGRQTGYLVSVLRAGSRDLIGFADTGLKQDYRNLGWVVLVTQEERDALAPVSTSQRLIALMALLGLGGVTLVAVYFSLHRTGGLTEIEEAIEAPQGKPASA
ncbi:MAG: cache domain-containing protein [Bryobacteraceae bacterium]